MATKKAKFNLDRLVEQAQKNVKEFIDTEFDKLRVETAESFAEARAKLVKESK